MGVTEERIYESAKLLNSIMGIDFFQKEEQKKYNEKNKNMLISRNANSNPIYQYCTSAQLEDHIWLIEIADCFLLLQSEISDLEQRKKEPLISRLKNMRLIKPALFELLVAKKLRELGFQIQLQKNNPEGFPVEIFAEKNALPLWVECKSSELSYQNADVNEIIFGMLYDPIHKAPDRSAVFIRFEKEIGGKKLKNAVVKVKELIKTLPRLPDEEILKIQRISKGIDGGLSVDIFRYRENHAQIIEKEYLTDPDLASITYLDNCITDSSYTGLPDMRQISKVRRGILPNKMMGVIRKFEKLSKDVQIVSVAKIKKAIQQQKSLLDKDEEVMIICEIEDSKQKEVGEIKQYLEGKNYPTLSVFLVNIEVSTEKGNVCFKFYPICCSAKCKGVFPEDC